MINYKFIVMKGLFDYFESEEPEGGQSQLARFLGVSKQAVNQWVSRGRISATAAIHVEALTGGAFRKEDLRPAVTKWIVK
jgi:DNA-binding transcriptional regulator YdaS (Cro superfamily)